MKISDIIQEVVISEAPPAVAPQTRNPGQLAQRAQQRNATPQPAQPASVQQPAQEPAQAQQRPAQQKPGLLGNLRNAGTGFIKGLGLDKWGATRDAYDNATKQAAHDAQAGQGQEQPTTGTDVAGQPTPAVEPQKPSGNTLAAQIKSEWDQFVQSGGNASPALKQQIKQMWLDAGGVRAESKKNKKRPI